MLYECEINLTKPNGQIKACLFEYESKKQTLLDFIIRTYKQCRALEIHEQECKDINLPGKYTIQLCRCREILGLKENIYFYNELPEGGNFDSILRGLTSAVVVAVVAAVTQLQQSKKGN